MERAGLPTTVVTAIPTIAEAVGANRITHGKAVSYPFGDPSLELEKEHEYRRRLMETALAALGQTVEGPTLFEVEVV